MKRTIPFILAVLGFIACAFLYHAIMNLAFSPQQSILPEWSRAYHLLGAALDTIPQVQAIVLLCCLLIPSTMSREEVEFRREGILATKGIVALCVICIIAYSLLLLEGAPRLNGTRSGMVTRSELFLSSYNEARRAITANERESADAAIGRCRILSPDNASLKKLGASTTSKKGMEEDRKTALSQSASPGVPIDSSTRPVTESVESDAYGKALAAFNEEDYFTAHALALKISTIDKTNREAAQLVALSWRKIVSVEESEKDKTRKGLAERKRTAYEELKGGNQLEALALFHGLSEEYPMDKMVSFHLAEAKKAVVQVAFYSDETTLAELWPSAKHVTFSTDKENAPEYLKISAKTLYTGTDSAFLESVSIVKMVNGSEMAKISAPAAKLMKNRLMLVSVDRRNPGKRILPAYTGAFSAQDPSPVYVDCPKSVEEMEKIRFLFTPIGEVPMLALAASTGGDPVSGADRQATMKRELVNRADRSVAFATLLFICLFLGMRLSWRGPGKLPLPLVALALPLALVFVMSLSEIRDVVSAGILARLSGIMNGKAAILVFACIQAGALVLSCAILLLSRGKIERQEAA